PLPIPPIIGSTVLTPAPAAGTVPGEAAPRPDHQFFAQFPPQKEYELFEREVQYQFYPAVDRVPTSPVWTFLDANAPEPDPAHPAPLGLRFNARYGEPIVVRIHNDLPANNHGFGINQTSTHLHNGHTASESDGGPTHFYDAGLFKDFHYLNVRAGFASN